MFPRTRTLPVLSAAVAAGLLLAAAPAPGAATALGAAAAGYAGAAGPAAAAVHAGAAAAVHTGAEGPAAAGAGAAGAALHAAAGGIPVGAAVAGASALPPAAGAAEWAVSPADAAGPDGRISLRHTIDPGSSATDAIAVTNLGAETGTFRVAAGDGIVGDDGAFDIAAGDPEGSGAWITIDGLQDGTIAVAPGETRVLPVRIDVPADVTPGDHPAGIVVGVTRSDAGVAVTNRVGVRLHLRVAGDVTPALEVGAVETAFTPSWVPFAPGTLRVETVVANTGNVRLGALAGVSGAGVDAARLAGDPVELLPGDSATVVTETSAWPMLAVFGTASVQPVAIGDDGLTAPASVEQSFVVAAPSWTGLALVVLAGGAIAVLILRRRATSDAATPTQDDAETSEPAPVPEAAGVR